MLEADWHANPYVQMVELDFVPGKLGEDGQMWCGFGIALILPKERNKDLQIHANQEPLFQAALSRSIYKQRLFSILNPLSYLKKRTQ